jgi:integrase
MEGVPMPKVLTDAAVRRFAPAAQRRRIPDGGMRSLFLVITPNGHKAWQMRFRVGRNRIGAMILGPVDLSGTEIKDEPVVGQPLSLAAARALAARVHRVRALGRDPVAEHKAAKARRRAAEVEANANAFGAVAKEYIERYASKNISRWKERARLLGWQPTTTAEGKLQLEIIRGGLAQRWSDKPIGSIDGHDVHNLLVETRERGAPGLERRSEQPTESRAHAMLATLSAMYGWLLQHRRVEANPCVGVHRPQAPAARDRVLSNDEIKAFWKGTETVGMPFSAVLKLLLLTGARLSEIEELRRDELAADASQINLPGSRTKNHRAHVIPLAPLAREIIASVSPMDDCPYVFTTNGKSPISIGSKVKARLDQAMGDPPPWRIHDLRRTFVTGTGELGVRPDVIELAVNHVSGLRGGVAGVYNKSELLPERKAAVERWSAHIAGLISGGTDNFVALHPRQTGAA